MKGNFKKGGWKAKNPSKNKEIEINFFLIDSQKVGIQIPYGYCVQSLKNCIRDIGEGQWSYDDKCWVITKKSYEQILQRVQDHCFRLNNEQQANQKIIKVNPIEDFVFKAEQVLHQQLEEIKITNLKPYNNITIKYNSVQTNIDPESLPFYNKLFDFQKQSLVFGIKHHGRMLLADEMGVGKTIQSLAVAYIFKHEWPLLIICPPSLKLNWQNQIKRWYADIQPHQIQLINNAKTAFRTNVLIMIVSYDLAWRMKEVFDHVRIVIADEAHYLKSAESKRSEALVPFLSTRKRVILLTGTPAFARPREIFNLISIVRPGLFKNFKMFGNRYCEPKWNHWSHSYQYNGCKNMKQLHYILKDNIMIRRLKCQVLKELPDKNRQKIILETDASVVKNIKEVLEKNNINKMETFFSEFVNTASSVQTDGPDKRQEIMQAYRLSGIAKIKAVRQYIDEILENSIKILVFAHHMKVMDEIESQLKNKKHKFIRIDGSVSQVQRQNNVQKFQNDPEILVALLSITAAGVGITLTAASTVIFAELHWTPALMIQAEDRAHRVGQKNSVNCHYLIGQNTLDEMLYKFLEKKVLNVSSFVDGESKDLQFEDVRKGEKGKFSKKQQLSTSFSTINRKSHFGSNLMLELSEGKNGSPKKQNTQRSQLTDISESTIDGGKVPSRKRVPSLTLDTFVMKRNQISEMTELKYIEVENSHKKIHLSSKIKSTLRLKEREKEEKTEEKQDTSIDSDEEFQKALQGLQKEKIQSIKNSQRKLNQNFETQSIKKSSKSSTQSIGNNQTQQQFEI